MAPTGDGIRENALSDEIVAVIAAAVTAFGGSPAAGVRIQSVSPAAGASGRSDVWSLTGRLALMDSRRWMQLRRP